MKRRTEEPGRHIVDILFVLALFAVFAASALMLVIIGANVYQQTVSDMDTHYAERTAYAYVSEKLRQNDTADAVSIGQLDGVPALILTEEINGESFCTYLYLYDGYLKELFVRKDSFSGDNILTAGQNILPLSSFSVEYAGDRLVKLSMDTGSGHVMTLYAALYADYS